MVYHAACSVCKRGIEVETCAARAGIHYDCLYAALDANRAAHDRAQRRSSPSRATIDRLNNEYLRLDRAREIMHYS